MMHLLRRKWKRIKGIWLPLDWAIGFNTLRWIVNGRYENGEVEIISKTLTYEDKVLEVGTGFGFVTSFCSLIVGDERVFSFEANPFNAEMARRVFQKNKVNPTLKNVMLGQKYGVVNFPINSKNRLASSLLDSSTEMIKVSIEPLNEVIRHLKPTFLVMDIEGGEYEIVRLIEPLTIKKIQFELHPELLGDDKCNELFIILGKHGFEKDEYLSRHPNYFYQRI
jgi:FkbM family methyltransferase